MILGVGLDLLDGNRIEDIFTKFKCKFANKILSSSELKEFNFLSNYERKVNFLAKKFSAKESFVKSIGIGMGRGVFLKDITIAHDNFGRPQIILENNAKRFIESYFSIDFLKLNIIISITDSGNFISTMVVLEKKNEFI